MVNVPRFINYPKFDMRSKIEVITRFKTARFGTVKTYYDVETDRLFICNFKFIFKTLAPSNKER